MTGHRFIGVERGLRLSINTKSELQLQEKKIEFEDVLLKPTKGHLWRKDSLTMLTKHVSYMSTTHSTDLREKENYVLIHH
jgi:hypothetical protein